MLAYYVLVFAVELSLVTHPDTCPKFKIVARYIAASAAAAACATILLMPFREPSLSSIDISAVGQQPSNDFRTPEDNLRLWQFLTVSWMAPLISTGRKRQLHEQDVWLLGFDFQHSRLHEKFRRLRGSVLSRLLRANGIDVFIISTISLVQMICGMEIRRFFCNVTLIIFRLFYSCSIAATIAGYERPVQTKTRAFDLCFHVVRSPTCRCTVTSVTSVVRTAML
jgi:hypothetical protein